MYIFVIVYNACHAHFPAHFLQSTMEEYESMPIDRFGEAVLKGMGWKKGEAIGRTNKG